MIKIGLAAALALGGLLFSTQLTSAQDSKGNAQKRPGGDPKQRVEQLATRLNLNAEQKTKLTAIFEDDMKKMRELRADQSVPQEQRREKVRAMREDTNKKVKAILTSEQWEKWEKAREELRQKGAEKRGEKKKAQQ